MFTDEQIQQLKAKLDKSHVKTRKQAGRELSYVEGWHAIAEANRIFGFDAWDRQTVFVRQVCEPYQTDGKWRVSYMAKVRVIVRGWDAKGEPAGVMREGCGYGSGIDRDLGGAHESAIKESETDSMKRALMTFGNPFGLALYDKEQANVETAPKPPAPSTKDYEFALAEKLVKCGSLEGLDTLWREEGAKVRAFTGDDYKRLVKMFSDRKAEINAMNEPNTVLGAA